VILLVHSSGLGAAQWTRLIRSLPVSAAVAVDLTGYGDVSFDPEQSALEQDVEVVLQHVRTLKAKAAKLHLVGHSYGGLVALKAALQAPTEVTRLTLIEPVVVSLLEGDLATNMAGIVSRFEEAMLGPDPEENALRAFVEFWSGPGAFDAMPEAIRQIMMSRAHKVVAEVRDVSACIVPEDSLSSLKVPAQVLLSEHHRPEAAAMCEALATLLNAPIRKIPGAHMSPVTHPQETAQLLTLVEPR